MKPTPSSAKEGFYFTRRTTDELHWKSSNENGKATFWRASETEWKGVLGLQAVTVTLPEEAATIGQREEQRVSSSRPLLRWKEDDSGHVAEARWCAHGFKDGFNDPDIHEIDRSCPTPEVAPINIMMQILASTGSEGPLADVEKAFMQGDLRRTW